MTFLIMIHVHGLVAYLLSSACHYGHTNDPQIGCLHNTTVIVIKACARHLHNITFLNKAIAL